MKESTLKNKIYSWRIRAALIAALLTLILARPIPWSIAAGGLIAAAGLLIRVWACGHIRKEKKLAVSGPYRYTRNPLYFGNFVLGAGIAAASFSIGAAVVFLVYFLIFYSVALLNEKEKMEILFPKEYNHFKAHVPLFFPRLRPFKSGTDAQHFDFQLCKENREQRALIGTVIVWILLTLKMIFL